MSNSTQLFKDDEEEARSGSTPSDDELRHITGITPAEEKDIDQRELDRREKQGTEDEGGGTGGTMGQTGLARAEEAAAQFGFRAVDGMGGLGAVKMYMSRNRRKALIGGSITTGVVGIFASIFFLLIPLKIEDVVTNVQNHFMSTSENAIERESDKLFTEYVTKHVLPGYRGKCGSTIDSRCSAAHLVGQSPVTRLFRSWSQAKLENKLASQYGIEFKYDTNARSWYLKAPGISGEGDPLGANPSSSTLEDEFQKVDRSTMRTAYRDALQNETLWKRVYLRYKVGRLLESKYGVKRCIIFCGIRDPLKDSSDAQKRSAKIFIANRVIQPRNKTLGVVLGCLFDPSCDPTKNLSPDTEDPSLNGSERSATEEEVSANFQKLAAQFGIVDAKALEDLYKTISDKGLLNYMVTQALERLVGQEGAKTVADKIPVVGWINLGDELYEAANDAGPKVKKLGYITNAAADVQMFQMYRTYADEVHTGHITATELGSIVDSLGPAVAKSKDLAGGTASAEQAPLYTKLMGSGATTGSDIYKCNGNKSLPAGKIVCPEEELGQGNGALNAIHNFLNAPGMNVLTTVANVWKSTIGKLFNLANRLIGGVIDVLVLKPIQLAADLPCKVPGSKYVDPYCAAKSTIESIIGKIMPAVVTWLIPNPFSSNMSGGRVFDSIAAGADVAGNESAHTILGGVKLTPKQTADIINAQQSEAQAQFNRQPLFARMFSTNSPYSLVSRLAVAVPFNFQSSFAAGFASFISNPFSSLAHGFGSIFTPRAAAATPDEDPFGVAQYGYPDGTIPDNPEEYWDQNCSDDFTKAYQNAANYTNNGWNQFAAAHPDEETGMPTNLAGSQPGAGTNPCMLIKATVGAVGGAMDTSLLTPDDLKDASGGPSAPTSPGTYKNPFRDVKNLGQSRVDQGVDYTGSGTVYAIGDGTVINTVNSGWPGGTFIVYQLTDGPAQGKYVYMAENCSPITVKIGQTVNADTPLCTMIDASPHIETGWADGSSIGQAAAHDVWVGNDSDAYYTAYGKNFSQLLQSLGTPPGIIYPNAQELGSLPQGWPTW